MGRSAAVDDTLMIEPPSPSAMRVPTSAVRRKGPLRFTSSTLSYSASDTSARLGYSGDMPALFTSTSTFPNSS